jgi:hypothetical protein
MFTTNESTRPSLSDQDLIDHYARMALIPGALDHARYQVRQMEKNRMYQGIGKAVAEKIKELKND